jgi:hypothetical protein
MQMAVHHALGMLPKWLAPPPLPTAAQPLTVRVSAGNHMVELNTPSPNTSTAEPHPKREPSGGGAGKKGSGDCSQQNATG